MSRSFNGTTDSITLNSSASLNTLLPAFTIMAWIFVTEYSINRSVISLGESIVFVVDGGDNPGSIEGLLLGAAADSISSNVVQLNTWTHVAMTYNDNTDRKAHLFINGTETSYLLQTPGSGSLTSIGGDPSRIGLDYTGTQFFKGDIAEVKFYNTVLTSAQIVTAMGAVVPLPGNLVAYLHLLGLQSPEPDASVNGNVGILSGTTPGPNPPIFNPSPVITPSLGQLLPEPYQPTPKQPGGVGTPVTDPVQKVDEKTGMFAPGCGHYINSYDIKQMSVDQIVSGFGRGRFGSGPFGTGQTKPVAMKIACCPVCGYVQQILPVSKFDGDPFTFIA